MDDHQDYFALAVILARAQATESRMMASVRKSIEWQRRQAADEPETYPRGQHPNDIERRLFDATEADAINRIRP